MARFGFLIAGALVFASGFLACGSGDECNQVGVCGSCSHPLSVNFTTVVVERDGGNVSGATVECIDGFASGGKPAPVITDADGRASMQFETIDRGTCGGWRDCRELRVQTIDGGVARFGTVEVNGARAILPGTDGGR